MPESAHSFLYIPDISGFTKFVNEVEIDHSQHIIKELLESIIDSNILNLKVSEVEGDAILFYKMNEVPTIDEIINQSKQMFMNFHQHLKLYQRDRICDCGACSTAQDLSLKIVAHAGDIRITEVRNFQKLMGSDVILIHRLLKNSVNDSEYLLLSKSVFDLFPGDKSENAFDWLTYKKGVDDYQDIGSVRYKYLSLAPLHTEIQEIPPRELPKKFENPVSVSMRINAPVKLIHHVITDIDIKTELSDDVREVVYNKKYIPRVGSSHQCIFPQGSLDFTSLQNEVHGENRVFAERLENFPIFKEANIIYTMQYVSENETDLLVEVHIRKDTLINKIKSFLFSRIIQKQIKDNLRTIKDYSEKVGSESTEILL